MSIKDLFGKKSLSVSSAPKTAEDYKKVESIEYVTEYEKSISRFVPSVDFEDPSKFARYGLAENYYEDAINYICKTYPYDGSFYEKKKWQNESSDLVNYFFENIFPRQNGFITLGKNYGTSSVHSSEYYSSSIQEYIYFKGTYNNGNKYDPSKNREYNIKIDGNEGNTVEFYLKKDNLSGSHKQIILDLWNGEVSSSSNYGRMMIEIRPGIVGQQDKIYFQISSGSDGYTDFEMGNGLDFTGSWHHYAVSYQNSGSEIKAQLLVDGDVVDVQTGGTAIGRIYGAMQGQIGALITAASGTVSNRGWGKLSGSIDEFRFWKKKRTDKEVSLNYYTDVGGGTNTDDSNVDLGIYYKFNEGIAELVEVDKIILDYSGRVSNGLWVGYSSGARSTDSAIVLSQNSAYEFKDPIIYSQSNVVNEILEYYKKLGKEYDLQNSSNLYNTLPAWKIDEDEESGQATKKLLQIISEIFDSIHNQIKFFPQIKDLEYGTTNNPYYVKLLENIGFSAPQIFQNAEIIEEYLRKKETGNYEEELYKVKNVIYQNIYNNLLSVYKSKGTIKSIRNALHAFGIDEKVLSLNMYADNAEIIIKDRFSFEQAEKKIINFNNKEDFGGVIYQKQDVENPNSLNNIPASSETISLGSTFEVELFFPKKFEPNDVLFFPYNYLTSSLFGMHENSVDNWALSDRADIQVFAVRPTLESKDAYFQISSSHFEINKFSNLIKDVYDDKKWNLAIRIKPEKYPLTDLIQGSSLEDQNYNVQLYGVCFQQDILQEEIILEQQVSYDKILDFYLATKKVYIGAHRNNFNGDVVSTSGLEIDKQYTDIEFSSCRYWNSFLQDETIQLHAKDSTNYGANDVQYRTAAQLYTIKNSIPSASVEQNNTLALHWNYLRKEAGTDTFTIQDFSSGSVQEVTDFVTKNTNFQFTGIGEFFNSLSSSGVKYTTSTVLKNYETITSEDLVQILDEYDDLFEREKKIVNYYFALEKSMYNVISTEMISWIGSVKVFNNLIGQPKYRYEDSYSQLRFMRNKFFENVENEPDLEKFLEFYKWIDDSICLMVSELLPVSTNYESTVFSVVESHVFERNKYRHKLPTLEFNKDAPNSPIRGVGEMLYPWKIAHAPLSNLEKNNCLWWNVRAERDEIRQSIFNTISSAVNKNFTSQYILSFSENPITNMILYPQKGEIRGTILNKNANRDIIIGTVGFDLSGNEGFEIPDLLPPREDCED